MVLLQTNLIVWTLRSFGTTCFNMGKKALVLVANGSEEIETVTPIDVLRRAGVEVTVAGLSDTNPQICSRNVILGVEKSFQEAKEEGPYDVVVIPGGLKGAEAMCQSAQLGQFLKEQDSSGRFVASICAGPTAIKTHGIGIGKKLTSYPSVKDKLTEGGKYTYMENRVVVDGNLITSRGPGTAMEFAIAIVENLVGKEEAQKVAKAMLMKD